MHDADKKGLKYLLEMKNERSKPFPMAKANAFFSRYKRLLMMGAQLSLARENQATKSERKDEEISICIIIYLAFEQWTKQASRHRYPILTLRTTNHPG